MKLGDSSLSEKESTPEEISDAIARFNQTASDYPRDSTVHAEFSAQAARDPEAVAVIHGDRELRYVELESSSNQIARLLGEHGVGAEALVGVLMEPSLELPAVLLGILKAGAAYVLVDPAWPVSRSQRALDEAASPVLIGGRSSMRLLNKLQWMCPSVRLLHCIDSDDIHSEPEEVGHMMKENVWDFIRREVFDDISGGGFRSSYTGDFLSREVIDQYADNIESKLTPLVDTSSRILEIGVASGISMYRLAPKVALYCGTDMSQNILDTTGRESAERGLDNVDLQKLAAHEIHLLESGDFDVAVINSVIQCFSGHNYLRDVVRQILGKMSDQGTIFLGNLWDQELQGEFEQSLVDFKEKNEGKGYRTKTDRSEDLFLAKSYWKDLQHEFPEIVEIEFSKMLGEDTSELSTWGYDAVLKIDRSRAESISLAPRTKVQTDRRALQQLSSEPLSACSGPRGLACVNFSSGATGEPEGVEIEHRSILQLVINTSYTEFSAKDRILQTSALASGASTMEIWGPLLNRGAVCFAEQQEEIHDANGLAELIRRQGVTQMWLAASSFNQLAAGSPEIFRPLENLLIGGEDLSPQHVNSVRSALPGLRLVACYGQNENTAFSTFVEIDATGNERIPAGRLVANSRAYILDEDLRPTQIGVTGELFIAGDGLARGYLDNEPLTAERFISHPDQPDERIFQTGDLARWTTDGRVELVDRMKSQGDVPSFWDAASSTSGPAGAEAGESAARVGEKVKSAIVSVLGDGQSAALTSSVNLAELGLDSMVKLDLQAALERSFGVKLDPMFLFEHENMDAITGYLVQSGAVADAVDNLSISTSPAAPPKADDVPLLTEVERQRVLVQWNSNTLDFPSDRCLHELFEEHADREPNSVAVVYEEQQLTYAELNARSNQLAHHLRDLGVCPESLVGLFVERSVEMVIGLLGILKAGGAYVPLDPAYPAARVAFMLQDTQAPVLIITRQLLLEHLPPHQAKVVCLEKDRPEIASCASSNPTWQASSDQLAYVIYTSGSTGKPKGVMVEHRSVANLAAWQQHEYRIGSSDRAGQLSSLSFDGSVLEIWPYLTAGAAVYVATEQTRASRQQMIDWWRKHRITQSFVPTLLGESLLQETLPADLSLEVLLTGGEQLRSVPRPGCPFRCVNVYGPTENTAISTTSEVTSTTNSPPPIGRPLPNVQAFVLNEELQPVAIGAPGELHLGGANLARGYLNRPDLTAEKFIRNPFGVGPESRLYKTGDLCQWLPDGSLEFLGRIDHQVKIRGYRIELGEIEAALMAHPKVRETVVLAREDQPGNKRLTAYVVGEKGLSTQTLQEHLQSTLPHYMIPVAWAFLDALPLNPNGKADRKALPDPDVHVTLPDHREADPAPVRSSVSGIGDSEPVREKVAAAISGVLGEAQSSALTPSVNLAELGLDSMKKLELQTALERVFDVRLDPMFLFQYESMDAIVGYFDKADQSSVSARGSETSEQIGGKVRTAISGVLGKAQAAALTTSVNLAELGLDSMKKLELQTALERIFEVRLDPMFLFQHESMEAIVDYLASPESSAPDSVTADEDSVAHPSAVAETEETRPIPLEQPGGNGAPERRGFGKILASITGKGKKSSAEMVETCLVQPVVTTEGAAEFEEPISAMDQMMAGLYAPFSFYYDELLDVSLLKKALAIALAEFPAIAARLDTKEEIYRIRGNDGVLWEVQRCSSPPPELDAPRKSWRKAGLVKFRKSLSFAAPDEPLLFVRISLYEAAKVSVVAINFNHVLCDGNSLCYFLQRWSYHCDTLSGKVDAPATPKAPPPLNQRIVPIAPDASLDHSELREAYPGKRFPFGLTGIVPNLLSFVRSLLASKEVDYRVDGEALQEITEKIRDELRVKSPEFDSVSSHQVLVAMMMRVLHRFVDRSDGKLDIALITSLRRHVSHYPGSFFGNAISSVFNFGVPVVHQDGGESKDLPLSAIVESIHRGLREELESGDELYWSWPESARQLGFGKKLFQIMFDTSTHGDLLFNGIGSYHWFALRMGTASPPTTMVPLFTSFRNHLFFVPLDASGDLWFSPYLSSSQYPLFNEIIEAHQLPIRPLGDR